ncbi:MULTISPECIES: hypothetical protein [unclassified Thiocapsa]|uniref:hypothetical protein n=1 Tax=unclassified Thiocapsa TaxID=2641286 RepID=UPI0035B3302F
MAIHNQIQFAELGELFLDPLNPRLGRSNTNPEQSQDGVLELMRDWTLDELAVSFLESGYWPQEAMICVREELYGKESLVVVEGNRRLAAIRYLKRAFDGEPLSRKWKLLIDGATRPDELFSRIPYILADERGDVDAFLGFRHVTGIKEWKPAEKAEYIAKLIDQRGMSYEEVMRAIGSKTEPVRRNYIAFRVLRQLEQLEEEDISLQHVEERFSVLYLSLREPGVQDFLGVNVRASPEEAQHPVPDVKIRIGNLANFVRWLFGTDKQDPLFTDSRNVGKFGKILESEVAVDYLKSTDHPSFDLAIQKAGAEESEIIELVKSATDSIELALGRAHLYRGSADLKKAVARLGSGAIELLRRFPEIHKELIKDDCKK